MGVGDEANRALSGTMEACGQSFRHGEKSCTLSLPSADEAIKEPSTSGRLWGAITSDAPLMIWNSGMTCMACASFLQSAGALCFKLTGGRIPVFQVVATRSAICMVVTIGMIKWSRITPIFGHMENVLPLLIRGGAGATSMTFYYMAINLLPLADVMTMFFTHPAMVVALAWLCRGEAVSWIGLLGMLLSLLGVVAVAQPPFLTGGSDWSAQHIKGVTDCLLAALMAAVAFVAIRFIPKSESSLSIALSFHTMGVITSVLPLAAGIMGSAVLPSLKDWNFLVAIATCSFTSHAFIARAFQVENAGKASAAGYLQVVFGYAYGIFIFNDAHNILGILGSIIICLGVAAVSWPSKDPHPSLAEDLKPEETTVLEMAPLLREPQQSPKEKGKGIDIDV